MTDDIKLPKLPDSVAHIPNGPNLYTADQMHAYAKEYGALCYEAGKAEQSSDSYAMLTYVLDHGSPMRISPGSGKPFRWAYPGQPAHGYATPFEAIRVAMRECGYALRAQPSAQDAGVLQLIKESLAHYDQMTEDADEAVSEFAESVRAALKQSLAQPTVKQSLMVAEPFQTRVNDWMQVCFGPEIAADKMERNHRFFEEATELVQACGMTASEAHQLVDYTFSRPVGEPKQETGGVRVTLAALCSAQKINDDECGETELTRIWTKTDQIRQKQAAKPKHSPLPMAQQPAQAAITAGLRESLAKIDAWPLKDFQDFMLKYAWGDLSRYPYGDYSYAIKPGIDMGIFLREMRDKFMSALEKAMLNAAPESGEGKKGCGASYERRYGSGICGVNGGICYKCRGLPNPDFNEV